MDEKVVLSKWKNHKFNSRKYGAKHLELDQYRQKLIDAGIEPEQVGQKRDNYHLARYTDSGDYTPDTCRFIPHLDNLKEQKINGGVESMRQKKLGRTKYNDPSVASQAKKMTGRTAALYPNIAIGSKKTAAKLRGRTKHNNKGRAIAAEKTEKEYSFISPDGIKHSGKGIREFAKRFGLRESGFARIRTGSRKQYRGWTIDPDWAAQRGVDITQ